MADLVKAAATAKRLVEANGRSVTLFKLNRTADNSAKPWRGSSAKPASSKGGLEIAGVKMAFVPASGSGLGKTITNEEGRLVTAYDQIGLLAADSLPSTATPADVLKADAVRDGSQVWSIEGREELKPADNSILFVLALKR